MDETLVNDLDRRIYEQEIRPRLPERIFDLHAHLLNIALYDDLEKNFPMALDPVIGHTTMARMDEWWQALFPDSVVNGLLLGFPAVGCNIAATNQDLAREVTDANNRFSILVNPMTTVDQVSKSIAELKPFGLKPYLIYAQGVDPQDARITDFMPEALIDVANSHGLAITLHVSKRRGMADEDNLTDIDRLTRDYPKTQFILAHCGRCFIASNMADAVKRLPRAANLWIDTSAVCDIGVFAYLFKAYDRRQICFGTDLVTASAFRGSYIGLGVTWDACTAEKMQRPNGQPVAATFCAYENVRAMLHGATICDLTEQELQDIFFNNAARLCGLDLSL